MKKGKAAKKAAIAVGPQLPWAVSVSAVITASARRRSDRKSVSGQ